MSHFRLVVDGGAAEIEGSPCLVSVLQALLDYAAPAAEPSKEPLLKTPFGAAGRGVLYIAELRTMLTASVAAQWRDHEYIVDAVFRRGGSWKFLMYLRSGSAERVVEDAGAAAEKLREALRAARAALMRIGRIEEPVKARLALA